MCQDTPNAEYLDPPLEKLKELYRYERLKDMDLDSLHNKEHELENKFSRIRAEFPPQESAMQGGVRKFIIGDDKKALTPKERKRISATLCMAPTMNSASIISGTIWLNPWLIRFKES